MASLILIVILITAAGAMITQPSFGAEIGLEILVVINTVLVKLLVGHALCLFKSFCLLLCDFFFHLIYVHDSLY